MLARRERLWSVWDQRHFIGEGIERFIRLRPLLDARHRTEIIRLHDRVTDMFYRQLVRGYDRSGIDAQLFIALGINANMTVFVVGDGEHAKFGIPIDDVGTSPNVFGERDSLFDPNAV